jgi:hypothetical protein
MSRDRLNSELTVAAIVILAAVLSAGVLIGFAIAVMLL